MVNVNEDRLTKFLLPVDKDGTLHQTASVAGAMAKVLGDRVKQITVLHVMAGQYLKNRMMNIDYRVDFVLENKVLQELKKEYMERQSRPILDEVIQDLKQIGVKAPIDGRIEDGDPVNKIQSICEEEGYSTIVMARRSLSPIKQILLGSVSMGILHRKGKASVYLLGKEDFPTDSCPVARTLIAIDGSDKSYNAVKEASILYKACLGRIDQITLLTVIDLSTYDEVISGGRSPEMEAKFFLDKAKMLLSDHGIPTQIVETKALYGRPADIICEEADKLNVQMIFLGRTGTSMMKGLFMGSVSLGVLNKCVSKVVALVN